jgi:glycosyltransferase involved in cell wall biosynthesis
MRIGIDGSNLKAGGGVTHLVELLNAAQSERNGFQEVIVWAGRTTLAQLPQRPWLQPVHNPMLDNPLPYQVYWRLKRLPVLAGRNCDVLFTPGAGNGGGFFPMVTMSQNMLPFEAREMQRYGISWQRARVEYLRLMQARAFKSAQGLIFLTQYARDTILPQLNGNRGQITIIPHGVSKRYFHPPRCLEFSWQSPIRILYVSIIDVYKHQWQVVEALARLRRRGLNVSLQLVGPAYAPALRLLYRIMRGYDPQGDFVTYSGPVPYLGLAEVYQQADIFVFASTCENMPNILLEAMASGLPIACSNRGPMPEVLGDAGVYFDPERPEEIADALQQLIDNRKLREQCAWKAYLKAQSYSWAKCADETFAFISQVAQEYQPR